MTSASKLSHAMQVRRDSYLERHVTWNPAYLTPTHPGGAHDLFLYQMDLDSQRISSNPDRTRWRGLPLPITIKSEYL